jgi:hypothetical protein
MIDMELFRFIKEVLAALVKRAGPEGAGHHSISMTVDIYGHWIPGEGKKDLTKTLRCSKTRPGRTLALATGADSPQVPR